MEKHSLDSKDWQLLALLQQDGRLSISDIANRLGRSRSNITERIEKLKDSGLLLNISANIDEEKLGVGISAFVRIQAGSSQHRTIVNKLCLIPEVAECHVLTGAELVVLRVVAKDMPHLRTLVDEMTKYGETQTDIIFSSVKRQLELNSELQHRLL